MSGSGVRLAVECLGPWNRRRPSDCAGFVRWADDSELEDLSDTETYRGGGVIFALVSLRGPRDVNMCARCLEVDDE